MSKVKTKRVFLLEPVKQRIDSAVAFGKLEYVFPPDAARSSIWDSDKLTNEILDALEVADYDPSADYIIATGHLVPVVTLVAAVASRYGEFQALLFNAADHCYVQRLLG